MLNFCPLCVAEVYTLRCDVMRAGTSHYPLHRPTTTYYLCCKDMQFFSICKTWTYQLQKGISKWVVGCFHFMLFDLTSIVRNRSFLQHFWRFFIFA